MFQEQYLCAGVSLLVLCDLREGGILKFWFVKGSKYASLVDLLLKVVPELLTV